MIKQPNKTSSLDAARIAGRVMKTGRYNQADVETLAGSVLAQKLPTKPRAGLAKKRPRG